jgi:hypothetical protein
MTINNFLITIPFKLSFEIKGCNETEAVIIARKVLKEKGITDTHFIISKMELEGGEDD